MVTKLKYSSNEFINRTKKSDEKALLVITDHTAQLKIHHEQEPIDPDYTLMYNRTFPLKDNAQLIYDQLHNVRGRQIGQTELVNIHLSAIKGEDGLAHDWMTRTQAIYKKNNPARFKAIWSKGLKPYNGRMDVVISALHTLSLNIGNDPNQLMMEIKNEVDAEYAIINPARGIQRTDIGITKLTSKSLHAACRLCMRMEYRNAGIILDKFDENINNIQESFHNMELLLDKQQVKWNITLNTLETKDIAKRKQLSQSKFRAKITGGNALMYLASTPGGIDSDPVVLTDGVVNNFIAAAFNVEDYSLNCYITVINQSNNSTRFNLNLG